MVSTFDAIAKHNQVLLLLGLTSDIPDRRRTSPHPLQGKTSSLSLSIDVSRYSSTMEAMAGSLHSAELSEMELPDREGDMSYCVVGAGGG